MRRFLLASLLLLLGGCTREQDYLDVMRDQQEAMQDAVEILQSVRDEKSMSVARVKMEELASKFDAIAARASALPKPPPRKVIERMQEDLFVTKRTMERLQEESRRVRELPGGVAFWKVFESHSRGLTLGVQP